MHIFRPLYLPIVKDIQKLVQFCKTLLMILDLKEKKSQTIFKWLFSHHDCCKNIKKSHDLVNKHQEVYLKLCVMRGTVHKSSKNFSYFLFKACSACGSTSPSSDFSCSNKGRLRDRVT